MTAYRHVRTSRLAPQRDVRWMVDPADLDQMPGAGRLRRGPARGGGATRGRSRWLPAWLAASHGGAAPLRNLGRPTAFLAFPHTIH